MDNNYKKQINMYPNKNNWLIILKNIKKRLNNKNKLNKKD